MLVRYFLPSQVRVILGASALGGYTGEARQLSGRVDGQISQSRLYHSVKGSESHDRSGHLHPATDGAPLARQVMHVPVRIVQRSLLELVDGVDQLGWLSASGMAIPSECKFF